MTIVLKVDDPRLGKYTAEGGYASWPEQNVLGQPYEQINATIFSVPGGFVVFPPDYKGDREITTQAAMVEPVTPKGRAQG